MDYEKNLIEALASLLSSEVTIAGTWKGHRLKYQQAREYIDYLSESKKLLTELDLASSDNGVSHVEVSNGIFIELSSNEQETLNAIRTMAMKDYDAFRRNVISRCDRLSVPEDTRSALMFTIQSIVDNKILEEAEANMLRYTQDSVLEAALV